MSDEVEKERDALALKWKLVLRLCQLEPGEDEAYRMIEKYRADIASAHAIGVAAERARCLAIVAAIRSARGTPEAEIACKLIELRIEDDGA